MGEMVAGTRNTSTTIKVAKRTYGYRSSMPTIDSEGCRRTRPPGICDALRGRKTREKTYRP